MGVCEAYVSNNIFLLLIFLLHLHRILPPSPDILIKNEERESVQVQEKEKDQDQDETSCRRLRAAFMQLMVANGSSSTKRGQRLPVDPRRFTPDAQT